MPEPWRATEEREALKATYGRYATSRRRRRAWAADNPGNTAIRQELLEHVLELCGDEIAGRGHILDIGCGGGWWLEALASHGVDPERLHGVDLLEERVAAAKRRLPGADLRYCDASALPYRDDGIQLVLIFTVLSSTSRRTATRLLVEAARVLAPRGRVLIYEPRLPNPLNPKTRWVRHSELEATLGAAEQSLSLTVLPALARRLGARTSSLYPRLRRLAWLRTHRLQTFVLGSTPGRAQSARMLG